MYAAGMAKASVLCRKQFQGVHAAALLHDIGKLAVPEHILSKPGQLTQTSARRSIIPRESRGGGPRYTAVPFPYPVAPIILSRHERWKARAIRRG